MPYHHGDLRRTLLLAARESLRTTPAADLSIRELARRVGVSANAPYRHFADRDALLAALVVLGYETVADALGERVGEGARAVGEVWSAFEGTDPELAALMTDPGVAANPAVAEAAERWFRNVVTAVEGELPAASPERVIARAIGCWAAVEGLERLRRTGALAGLEDLLPSPRRVAVRAVRGEIPR
jgi:AcrR family transcriptional regulator